MSQKGPYAYVVGSDTCGNDEENGGLHTVDISDPLKPAFADQRWFLFGDELDEQEHGQNTTTYCAAATRWAARAPPLSHYVNPAGWASPGRACTGGATRAPAGRCS